MGALKGTLGSRGLIGTRPGVEPFRGPSKEAFKEPLKKKEPWKDAFKEPLKKREGAPGRSRVRRRRKNLSRG